FEKETAPGGSSWGQFHLGERVWLSRPPRKSLLAPGEGTESPLNNQRVHFDAPPFIALADKTAVSLDYWETKEESNEQIYRDGFGYCVCHPGSGPGIGRLLCGPR